MFCEVWEGVKVLGLLENLEITPNTSLSLFLILP